MVSKTAEYMDDSQLLKACTQAATSKSTPLASGRCSWQGIDRYSRIGKGSQNILIYHFIINTFDCLGGYFYQGISFKDFIHSRIYIAPLKGNYSEVQAICPGTPWCG